MHTRLIQPLMPGLNPQVALLQFPVPSTSPVTTDPLSLGGQSSEVLPSQYDPAMCTNI